MVSPCSRCRGSLLPVLTLLLFLLTLGSTPPAPPLPGFFLRPRDVIVFLGDSITENGRFIGYLEEYVRGAHPSYQVRFINAGWGGDRVMFGDKEGGSPGALARVERDVLSHHPTVVVILLGMNDGRSTDAGRLEEFRKGMSEIIRRVRQGSKARIVLLSGTPYDVTRRPGEDKAVGENVGRFARAVAEIGRSAGIPVIDLYDPLTRLLRDCGERRPPVVLIPDGVHPTPVGHLVMASRILQGWHAPLTPHRLTLRARTGVLDWDGCEVRAFRKQADAISFDRRLSTLPIAVGEPIRSVLAGDPVVWRLYTDWLVVEHLPAARYRLDIDGRPLAMLTRQELAAGVDLTRLEGAPDAVQARRVAGIAQESLRLRHDAWLVEQIRLAVAPAPPPLSRRQRVLNALRSLLGKPPPSAPPARRAAPPLPADWKQRMDRLDRSWRAAVTPQSHQFRLSAVR